MKKVDKLHILFVGFFLFFVACESVVRSTDWSYSGKTGPENWSKLSPQFAKAVGENQSPINLDLEKVQKSDKQSLSLNYQAGFYSLLNKGHSIELTPAKKDENYLIINGERYSLQEIHFHVPSEHQINGNSLDMEAHLVHQNSKGQLAVVGVLFEKGKENLNLKEAWEILPAKKGKKTILEASFNAGDLLPEHFKYLEYSGSLTSPPTKEIVSWIVVENVLNVSCAQVETFRSIIGNNARPIQKLNGRYVTQSNF